MPSLQIFCKQTNLSFFDWSYPTYMILPNDVICAHVLCYIVYCVPIYAGVFLKVVRPFSSPINTNKALECLNLATNKGLCILLR